MTHDRLQAAWRYTNAEIWRPLFDRFRSTYPDLPIEVMRTDNRFPSNDFANIFLHAYNFVNSYPNIRHTGNATCVRRELRKEDAVLSALLFVGLSACVQGLCTDKA